jgi:hypothetical protein
MTLFFNFDDSDYNETKSLPRKLKKHYPQIEKIIVDQFRLICIYVHNSFIFV